MVADLIMRSFVARILSDTMTSLRVDELESRDTPTVFLVTSAADSGSGTLREALALANAQPNPYPDFDVIQFDSSLNGQSIAISGALPVTNTVQIIGPGANLLTITHTNSNNGTPNDCIFIVDDGTDPGFPTVGVTISGLTLANGGGAVFNRETTHVEDCVITGNHGGALNNAGRMIVERTTIIGNLGGGGIVSADGRVRGDFLRVNDSTITGNSTTGDGGGIYALGETRINNTTISGNFAAGNGGGFVNGPGGFFVVEDSTIANNEATLGGGIFNLGDLGLRRVDVTGNEAVEDGGGINHFSGSLSVGFSTISGNTAGGIGGGVSVGHLGASESGIVTIADSTFASNTANGGGGGFAILNATNAGITRTSITGNTSTSIPGGGMAAFEAAKFTVSDSTVDNNSGGGIFNSGSEFTVLRSTVAANPDFGVLNSPTRDVGGGVILPATLNVTNSTISGNDTYGITSDGALSVLNATIVDNDTGIRNDGTAVVKNTIVAGNAVADIAGTNLDAASANNLIGDPSSTGGLTHGTNGNIVGKDDGAGGRMVLPLAEVLDPVLRDNGGPTFTHKLVLGGPAIDAGNNASAASLFNDQRGVKFYRIAHTTVDIGAFEVQVPVTLAASGPGDGATQLFVPDATGAYSAGHAFSFAGLAANVRTAVADVNGDSFPDTIFVTGPGVPIRVAVVSGADHTTVLVAAFDPFGGDFTGGGFVAAESTRAGRAEFAVTPDLSGGPRVVIFSLLSNGTLRTVNSFLGIDDPNFRGGARPAYGDVDRDGIADLLVAAGFGGGPRVALFRGYTLEPDPRFYPVPIRLVPDFFAFPDDAATLRNGVFAALGDVDGDGFADPIFGGGPGGAPRVYILSGRLLLDRSPNLYSQPIANFFLAGNSTDRGGVRVAAKNADGDARADVATGSGEGLAAGVRTYLGADFTGTGEPAEFQDLSAFNGATLPGGVFVG